MRETGERAGRVESFPPKTFISEPKRSLYYNVPGAYILPQPSKITKKNQNQKLLQGTKREEKKKGTKKVKNKKVA